MKTNILRMSVGLLTCLSILVCALPEPIDLEILIHEDSFDGPSSNEDASIIKLPTHESSDHHPTLVEEMSGHQKILEHEPERAGIAARWDVTMGETNRIIAEQFSQAAIARGKKTVTRMRTFIAHTTKPKAEVSASYGKVDTVTKTIGVRAYEVFVIVMMVVARENVARIRRVMGTSFAQGDGVIFFCARHEGMSIQQGMLPVGGPTCGPFFNKTPPRASCKV
ncbi:MAG: hypothetical protein M1836_001521 [Candelina mexicana]|nr:MAG: hypothetical protein M1836_001521 [Candelina mexicana]